MPGGPRRESVHGTGTQQMQGEALGQDLSERGYLGSVVRFKMCEESVIILLKHSDVE